MKITTFLNSFINTGKNPLLAGTGFGLANGLLIIVQAWFLSKIINDVIFNHSGIQEVKKYFIPLLLVFLFRGIFIWLSKYYNAQAAEKIKMHVRTQLHEHLLSLGPVYSGNKESGALVNTLVDGVEALEKYFSDYLPGVVYMAVIPLVILFIVFPVDLTSALVLLFTAPVLPFFMILIGKGAEKLNIAQWKKLAVLSNHFMDVIQGLPVLKIFNASKREARLIYQFSQEYKERTMRVLRVAFLSALMLEFFASIGTAIVAVLIGFRLLDAEILFFNGLFALMLAPEFYQPMRNMGTNYHARMEAIGAAEKMLEILRIKPEIKQIGTGHNHIQTSLEKKKKTIEIELKNVSYTYPDGYQAMKNINLHIPARKTVAVIGKTGAGKTTLFRLLLGFVRAQQGAVLINGKNLYDLSLDEWRRNIAWLPQQAYLFHTTVLENIKLGKPDATMDEVEQAARLAYCHDFIMKLPNGYHTLIGERGAGLSVGQRQRIALARAFLKKASVLFLDEATANLDKESEKYIEKSIARISGRQTIIMIAHRLHTIRQADLIIWLHKGKVLETGSHDELISRSKDYKKLIENYYKSIEV